MHILLTSLHTTNVAYGILLSQIPDEAPRWCWLSMTGVMSSQAGARLYLNTKIIPRLLASSPARPTRETLDLCKLELTDDIWWRVTRVNVITTHIIAHPLWLRDTFTSSSNSLRNSQRPAKYNIKSLYQKLKSNWCLYQVYGLLGFQACVSSS